MQGCSLAVHAILLACTCSYGTSAQCGHVSTGPWTRPAASPSSTASFPQASLPLGPTLDCVQGATKNVRRVQVLAELGVVPALLDGVAPNPPAYLEVQVEGRVVGYIQADLAADLVRQLNSIKAARLLEDGPGDPTAAIPPPLEVRSISLSLKFFLPLLTTHACRCVSSSMCAHPLKCMLATHISFHDVLRLRVFSSPPHAPTQEAILPLL